MAAPRRVLCVIGGEEERKLRGLMRSWMERRRWRNIRQTPLKNRRLGSVGSLQSLGGSNQPGVGTTERGNYSNGASEAGSFSTTGPGQLRAVKDGEELLSYESTSLALNSTNPVTPSAATTPSTQSLHPIPGTAGLGVCVRSPWRASGGRGAAPV